MIVIKFNIIKQALFQPSDLVNNIVLLLSENINFVLVNLFGEETFCLHARYNMPRTAKILSLCPPI